LFTAGLLNEFPGQGRGFAHRDHPADDVTAEDIEDDREIVVVPLGGTAQFRDVPTPQLVRSGGEQFRLLISGMNEQIAALPRATIGLQDLIHGAR
jgi:hypothetical protein